MAEYAKTSPYFKTPFSVSGELGTFVIRPIPANDDDVVYTIENQYTHRPDLLAYDLYGSSKLWWVFAQRNMDILQDPVYDLRAGVEIKIPKGSNLRKILGF